MQFQQVMVIKNHPKWASVTNTSMHPPTSPGSDNFSELNVAQFLKKYQEDCTIGSGATAIFTETEGQVSTSVAIMLSQDNTRSAYLKTEIKSLFQEMIGDASTVEVEMWPPVEEDDPNDNETLFLASAVHQDANNDNQIDLQAEMQQLKHGLSDLNEVAKILLEFKAALTASLTSVASPAANTSVSSLSDAFKKAAYNGMEKAQLKGGFYMRRTNRKPWI
jgi:hypothetical protein